MALVRFNPLIRGFPEVWRGFDELFRDAAPVYGDDVRAQDALIPSADVVETSTTVEIRLDLPGVKPEDIDVKVEGNLLSVTAERKADEQTEGESWIRRERSWGKLNRSFTLPNTLDGTTPDATYRQGVLTVVLPKKPEVLPRSLKIKVEG